jgi:hypothetical protein
MIVAATTPAHTSMNTHHDTLERMQQALGACERGDLPIAQLSQQWRSAAAALPLPPRYGEVLGHLLDRIEAGALFSEESCSFSQKDLLNGLQVWAGKAGQALNS